MPLGAFFFAVDELPPALQSGGIYFIKRPDGDLDLAVAQLDLTPVWLRRPHLQIIFEARGAYVPANAEFGRYYAKEAIALDALLSGVVSSSPSTNEAIITVTRGVDLVARYTFPPGSSQGNPEIIMPTVAVDDLLIFNTPSVQDPTLAGVTGTLGGRRT